LFLATNVTQYNKLLSRVCIIPVFKKLENPDPLKFLSPAQKLLSKIHFCMIYCNCIIPPFHKNHCSLALKLHLFLYYVENIPDHFNCSGVYYTLSIIESDDFEKVLKESQIRQNCLPYYMHWLSSYLQFCTRYQLQKK
jgi:hypothetical protein